MRFRKSWGAGGSAIGAFLVAWLVVAAACPAQITSAGVGGRIEFSSGFAPLAAPPGFVSTGLQRFGPGQSMFLQRFHFSPEGYAEGGTALGLIVPNAISYFFSVPTNSYLFQARSACNAGSLPAVMRIRFDAKFTTGAAGLPAHIACLQYPVVGRNGPGAGSFTAFEGSLTFGFRDPFPNSPITIVRTLVIRYVDRRPGAAFAVVPFAKGAIPAIPPGKDFCVWGDVRFTVRGCPLFFQNPIEIGGMADGGEIGIGDGPVPANDPTIGFAFVDDELIIDMSPFGPIPEDGPMVETVVRVDDNHEPVLDPIGPITAEEGLGLTFATLASDSDFDDLTFTLEGTPPPGATITPDGIFDWVPTAAGMYDVTIRVTDNGSPALFDEEVVTIAVGNGDNAPPVLDPIGPIVVGEFEAAAVLLTAFDPDFDDFLTYDIIGPVPSYVGLDPFGTLFITPTEEDAPSLDTIRIRVTDDGTPALWHERDVTIQVTEFNDPPLVDPVKPVKAEVGTPVAFTVTATDPDIRPGPDPKQTLEPLAFTLDGAPTGAAIDIETGEFTWTPTRSQDGQHDFSVIVTDRDGASVVESVSITVTVDPVADLSTRGLPSR